METEHTLYTEGSSSMRNLRAGSISLVVTSPPYPMVRMWDGLFAERDSYLASLLAAGEGEAAFERMHAQLDRTWDALARVLHEGAFVCINIGDATRSLQGEFKLYPNAARIGEAMRRRGFSPLPSIVWRKSTNAPTKFMGSGVLPAGAYVTLEHEKVLIFRKGGKRRFTEEEKERRRESAFFYEERNTWFSDVWRLGGERQRADAELNRSRTAAFPLALPQRLINMYSIKGDTVLDPFAGTGTTLVAAGMLARNSIGYEYDESFLPTFERRMQELPVESMLYVNERLNAHNRFVESLEKPPKHTNPALRTRVFTKQETQMTLEVVTDIRHIGAGRFRLYHG